MDTNIIDKVKQLADSAKRDDGWTNLAALGLSLNVNNIDIKSLGYYRLKAFRQRHKVSESLKPASSFRSRSSR